jgi:DNA-binding IclR family transcriptional regulator
MKSPTKQSERHVEAVLAALKVLDCFLAQPALSTKQIVELTGFTRNRVMRLTGTLCHQGYLLQAVETGAFTPGPKTLALGKVFERNNSLVSLARPILRALALKTGESVSLYIREGLERVVLAREEGTHSIRYTITEGQRMDLHAGAGGKALLAFAPEEFLQSMLKELGLIRRTSRTIVDPRKFAAEMKKIRRQGFAESMGERVQDACAVAAPVFDNHNRLLCAMAIVGPVSRFTPKNRQRYINDIIAAARELSENLGWVDAAKEDRDAI